MANKVTVGIIPAEATSDGGLNESTPPAQRAIGGAPLSEGPNKGEKDNFLPASYKTSRGLVRTDR